MPPSLVELEPPLWCPDGFSFDEAYHLCVSETLARGPFRDPMIEQCLVCGAAACDEEDWPAELARGLRGTERCPPRGVVGQRLPERQTKRILVAAFVRGPRRSGC
ncbi:MAG: hypothetical protein AAGF11_08710 [Myxococcota bacterium]